MVLVELSEGARDASPDRCERPSTAAEDGMFVVSRRLPRGLESVEAVWGRAGKVKVGRMSRGCEVIIIKQPGLRPVSLDSARSVLIMAKTLLSGPACASRGEKASSPTSPRIWRGGEQRGT
jgi:hypothetical protein